MLQVDTTKQLHATRDANTRITDTLRRMQAHIEHDARPEVAQMYRQKIGK